MAKEVERSRMKLMPRFVHGCRPLDKFQVMTSNQFEAFLYERLRFSASVQAP